MSLAVCEKTSFTTDQEKIPTVELNPIEFNIQFASPLLLAVAHSYVSKAQRAPSTT
jgi:hypothetical protein